MPTQTKIDDCLYEAKQCIGAYAILEKRAKRIKTRTKAILVLNIVYPAIIFFLSQNIERFQNENVNGIIASSIVIFLLNGISFGFGWDRQYQECIESKVINLGLHDDFKNLSKDQSLTTNEFNNQYGILKERSKNRTAGDRSFHPSNKEERYGVRYALMKFSENCQACGAVPKDMKKTDCLVCGKH